MNNNPIHVTVRMYKVGELGDCFLLRFRNKENSCNVLVDCGSFRNKKESVERMNDIWKDIAKEMKGKPLDVVVGTHQHNDHLSGFVHGVSTFKNIKTDKVWLSWLDDPRDSQARSIKEEQEKAVSKVVELGERLAVSGFNKLAVADRVTAVLGFNDPVVPAEGLRILKNAGTKPPSYLEPGEIIPLPNLEDEVKVYVLGPPKDKEKLRDIHSSANESYDPHLSAARIQADKMLSAFNNFTDGADKWEETHFPFTDHYKIPSEDFAGHSANSKQVWQSYMDEEWRKIDEDWLDEAGNLALYMDRYTNNTSLVLAFQLVRSGKFLLFVGDAQTGNWNSWKQITWPSDSGRFSVNDLLNNTILYKVGHHCSHNATSVEGLEAMTDEDLVAMIPVDATDPNITKKKGWKMPAKNLYKRLQEKTRNRVIRMDVGFIEKPVKENGKLKWDTLSHPNELEETDLYVQYEFTR